jgi:hypothetical protein
VFGGGEVWQQTFAALYSKVSYADLDETALAVLARIASDTLRSKCCDFVK